MMNEPNKPRILSDEDKERLGIMRARYEQDLAYEKHGRLPGAPYNFRDPPEYILLTVAELYQARKNDIARKFAEFQAYDSLEEILKEWPQSTTTFSEVKFVKPSRLTDWQSTIYTCATMVKVFKTLKEHMAANTDKYNFIYQCKTLFRKTTHVFEFDPTNFAFIMRTGLGSGGQEIKNKPVDFYENVLQQLQHLLKEMQQELPSSHFEQVFALYVLIKDKKKASY